MAEEGCVVLPARDCGRDSDVGGWLLDSKCLLTACCQRCSCVAGEQRQPHKNSNVGMLGID